MINDATKSALLGAAFGGAVWVGTGMWQFFAVATVAALGTWMFTSPPDRPQPRPRVREFRMVPSMKCFDYGGCQWQGDGAVGHPMVIGRGAGCPHVPPTRPDNCVCDNVPCTCSPRDRMVGRMWSNSGAFRATCPRAGGCDGSVRCPCMGD